LRFNPISTTRCRPHPLATQQHRLPAVRLIRQHAFELTTDEAYFGGVHVHWLRAEPGIGAKPIAPVSCFVAERLEAESGRCRALPLLF